MIQRRMLVIGLDGFDMALAERFMAEGALPNIARLRRESARFDLEHGLEKYSGLSWEQIFTGMAPEDGGRWSPISFDPATYSSRQNPTTSPPFLRELAARTVVFSVPYCDLAQAPQVLGLADWGAHDPGSPPVSRPAGLHAEIEGRFGLYPATEWLYGFCWPSAQKTQAAGAALAAGVELRSKVARWLLSERLPDWDLALVVVTESHSAAEALWHGVDASHPLHDIKTSAAAGEALRGIYGAIDRLVGDLQAAFPDAALALFAPHGMGTNDSDVPTMALLPELLYRAAFGKPYLEPIGCERATAGGVPLLNEDESWDDVLLHAVPNEPSIAHDGLWARLSHRKRRESTRLEQSGVGWMPAARYARFWPKMRAFALPAYYDGRVRINLRGREARGIVPREDYDKVCDEFADLIRGCRNLLTGETAIAAIYRPKRDPQEIGPSEADLYVIWKGATLGLSAPGLESTSLGSTSLGSIGPLPFRRTGGHTGGYGFLFVAGEGVVSGSFGKMSSFDVFPTLLDLRGKGMPNLTRGTSWAARLGAPVGQL
jgi:predicted AlkP superfamily phosphohydrolase/phosphomutase